MMLRRHHIKNEVTEEPTRNDNKASNILAYDDITKATITQLLTDKGIECNPRDTKQKLYDLLLGSE